jgi:TonB family protein
MVLRLTSSKLTEARESRDEHFSPGEERDASPDKRSPRTIREGNVGSRELRSQKKVVLADLALDWVLQEIVQQARLSTTATGAFIGLVRGHKIVGQATSGSNAGEFVAYLNRDRRMIDSSLRSATVQICRDSEASEELDASLCRYLGARSIVLVPILDEAGEKLGIFGVFSPQVDAFSSANIVALQSLSHRIADAMAQLDRCTSVSEGIASAPLRPEPSTRMTHGSLLGSERRSFAAVRSPAVWGIGILAAVLLLSWTVSRAISQRAMHSSARASAVVAPSTSSVSAPMASEATSSLPAQPSSGQPSFNQPPSDKPSSDQSSSNKASANSQPSSVAIDVVKPPSRPVAPNVKPAAGVPAAAKAGKKISARSDLQHVPDLEIENALDDASSPSLASPSVEASRAPNQPTTVATPRSAASDKKATSTNSGSPRVPVSAASAPPPREAVHLTRVPDPPSATTPLLSGTSQNAGPANASSPPAGPVVIPEKTALERVVEKVKPDYPEDAMAQNVQGAVTVDVVVGRDGQVENATPVDGDSRLLASAVKAVRKWHFAPLLRNGHFVNFETHITLHFALP